MLDERKRELLKYIVEEYIATAQPVGSSHVVKKYKLGVSPATVRNDMAALEEAELIESPHTSSGRIPTEKGYVHYVLDESKKDLSYKKKLLVNDNNALTQAYSGTDEQSRIKQVAKTLAEISQSAVVAGFSKYDIYYTGLSYLFSQPEFKNRDLVYTIGGIVDHLDEHISEVFEILSCDVRAYIGQENPLSPDCSFIGFSHIQNNSQQLFGLLGPMRMPYMNNIERVECVKELMTSN